MYIPSYSATEAAVRAEVAEVVSPPEFRSFGFTAFVKLYNIHEKLYIYIYTKYLYMYFITFTLVHTNVTTRMNSLSNPIPIICFIFFCNISSTDPGT